MSLADSRTHRPIIGLAERALPERHDLSEDELFEALASFEFDPEGFVDWAYPWGEAGTALEFEPGPDEWQRGALRQLGEKLRAGGDLGAVVLMAIRSGHGVGKSAFSAWIVQWSMSTHERTLGVATAMTETQLKTKTWAALAKWHDLFIAKHLFVWHAQSYRPTDPAEAGQWSFDAIPWSPSNPSSFQGLHNKGKRCVILYDEAAEIHPKIWELQHGALFDANTQIVWIVLGNPTSTTGDFYDKFTDKGKREGWLTRTVDARSSRLANKVYINSMVETYGDGSDFVRVRVLGLPPRAGMTNFIGPEEVRRARDRVLRMTDYMAYPIVMAVDPAEFGDNFSVISVRQGPKVHKQYEFSGIDGIDLAGHVVDIRNKEWSTCQWVGVESTGIGAACVAALRRVTGFPLYPINPSLPAGDDQTYANVRAEAWGRMREALKGICQWPDNDKLQDQACAVMYGYDSRLRYQLEAKKDMRSRGVPSPDNADSLALTYVADTITVKPGVKARALPQRRRLVIM